MFNRRFILVVLVCTVWFGVTSPGLADLRIVTVTEGERTELLFKENRIGMPAMDAGSMFLQCDTGELTMLSPAAGGRYWQGHISEFQSLFDNLFGDLTGDQGMPDLSGAFGALFGSAAPAAEVGVRVTKVGDETVAGYAAEHYRVETGSGNQWRVYEEIWVSRDLMRLVEAEVGTCVAMMTELTGALSEIAPFGLGEIEAVINSSEYQALTANAMPVRSITSMNMFGMTFDVASEVVEVSTETIPDAAFSVPAGYRRVNSPIEIFEM